MSIKILLFILIFVPVISQSMDNDCISEDIKECVKIFLFRNASIGSLSISLEDNNDTDITDCVTNDQHNLEKPLDYDYLRNRFVLQSQKSAHLLLFCDTIKSMSIQFPLKITAHKVPVSDEGTLLFKLDLADDRHEIVFETQLVGRSKCHLCVTAYSANLKSEMRKLRACPAWIHRNGELFRLEYDTIKDNIVVKADEI